MPITPHLPGFLPRPGASRRRINRRSSLRPSLALTSITGIALATAATFGIAHSPSGLFASGDDAAVLVVDDNGSGPITAAIESTSFDAGDNIVVDDPAIVTQGEAPGPKAVKEFYREEPFDMFALNWSGDKEIAAFFRSERPDGTWTEWFDAEPVDQGPRGVNNGRNGTEPVFVEKTNRIQVSTAGVDMAEAPADLEATFIDGKAAQDSDPAIELTADSDGITRVVSRAGWGADESLRCSSPTYNDEVNAITIHHTAGSNNYTRAEAAGVVRGTYQYHAQRLGWCDIGYHALVDKFGTIYEGRYGGLNRAVEGAHAGGFNENTMGISMMGDYSTVRPSDATIRSVGELTGWKARVSGFDPLGYDTHYSEGTSYSKYPYGAAVTLPNIFAHRDVGNTVCPGDAGYARMDDIRRIAKQKYDSLSGTTVTDTNPNPDTGVRRPSPGTGGIGGGSGRNPGGTGGYDGDASGSSMLGSSKGAGDVDRIINHANDLIDAIKTIDNATKELRN